MKLALFVIAVCALISPFATLMSSQQETINEITAACTTQLNITIEDTFHQPDFNEGDFFHDERKNKQFIACIFVKLGAVSADGKILGEKLLQFVAGDQSESGLKNIIDKCVTVEGDTIEDRAYNFHKCFWIERVDES